MKNLKAIGDVVDEQDGILELLLEHLGLTTNTDQMTGRIYLVPRTGKTKNSDDDEDTVDARVRRRGLPEIAARQRRLFRNEIDMGNSTAVDQSRLLLRRVDEGLDALSALQQAANALARPDGEDPAPASRMQDDARRTIVAVVKDVAAALLGMELKIDNHDPDQSPATDDARSRAIESVEHDFDAADLEYLEEYDVETLGDLFDAYAGRGELQITRNPKWVNLEPAAAKLLREHELLPGPRKVMRAMLLRGMTREFTADDRRWFRQNGYATLGDVADEFARDPRGAFQFKDKGVFRGAIVKALRAYGLYPGEEGDEPAPCKSVRKKPIAKGKRKRRD